MLTKMTWNPIDPAPYESAWSIFAKLLMLNYCLPLDIAKEIKIAKCKEMDGLDFRDSSWIDFDRFGMLLNVDPCRLMDGFLDRFGFPIDTNAAGAAIRFCPDCLAHGYHCTFFDLALIASCPIHHRPLQVGCPTCYRTVYKKGLARTPRPHQIPGGMVHPSMWRGDVYSSPCGHLHFDPELFGWQARFNQDQTEEIRHSCEAIISWWDKICSASNAYIPLRLNLARTSMKHHHGEILTGLSLEIARKIAGACPWSTSVAPIPADWIKFSLNDPTEKSDEKERIPFDSEIGTVYRAIRRHLFSKYVRPHKRCWQELSKYEHWMSRVLSGRRVCIIAMTYMSWRMSIEGFSNIEGFRTRHPVTPYLRPAGIEWSSRPSIVELAHIWYLHFYLILGQIEKLVNTENFCIERGENINPETYATVVSAEGGYKNKLVRKTCFIIYHNTIELINRSANRCNSRGKSAPTMLSQIAVDQFHNWSWGGAYSESSNPMLLFRVKDDRTLSISRQSYVYITV